MNEINAGVFCNSIILRLDWLTAVANWLKFYASGKSGGNREWVFEP
jgi:hypothetical protein